MEKVMVVDDDSDFRNIVREVLTDEGFQTVEARDGLEAVQLSSELLPDVVLMDLRMPRMDGIEFTRSYRSREASGRHLPIYALTANTAEDAMTHCLDAGMDGFLNKPVEPEQLEAIVERYAMSQHYRNSDEPPWLMG